jgi:hypothetical protein
MLWSPCEAFLIWRAWLHHGPVSPLKNTSELSETIMEINNLRWNRLPALHHQDRTLGEFQPLWLPFPAFPIFKEPSA